MPTPAPLNPAAANDPFPDWPLGEEREPRVADECFWLPEGVATCPECGGRLYIDIYEVKENGDASSIHWYCERAVIVTPKTDEDFRHQHPQPEMRVTDRKIREWLNSHYCWSMQRPHRTKRHLEWEAKAERI
jgi:hypothetical protein